MHPVKIVVSGPMGAGKTTFVSTLSETPVVCTDELVSSEPGKFYTTVAMDFGTLNIGEYPIYLYGTPGQERFDYMWEVLCEGALGLLLLLDGSKPKDFPKARNILDFIISQTPIPFIIGVTHVDATRSWSPEDVAQYFQVSSDTTIGLDPRNRDHALESLYHLFAVINSRAAIRELEMQTRV